MATGDLLTNRDVYEARTEDGQIYGTLQPRDWSRFRQLLRFIPKDTRSLLDCGCDRGHWLAYVLRHRQPETHLGIDISQERIEEAKATYPNLHVQAGYLEDLEAEPKSYELVTCLEVLEHIPCWLDVFERLLQCADRHVVISVPYKERILETVCIHCGKLTPMYGHLHVFSEDSFPDRIGWRRHFGYIKDYGIGSSWIRRLYRLVRPRRPWLVAIYDRCPQ